jgi:hypothetical protein
MTTTATCPCCNRPIRVAKDGTLYSHRVSVGRFGRGPYCEGSAKPIVQQTTQQATEAKPEAECEGLARELGRWLL